MQSLLDINGVFQLPTGWHEVTTRQFCDTDPLMTVEQRASYFAGRPIQVNGLVADALAWMLTPPPTDGGLPYPADLGQETYLQVEELRASLAMPLRMSFGHVYGTFVARRRGFQRRDFNQGDVLNLALHCLDLLITDTYPAVAHCLAELDRLATKYAELSEPDPTEAAQRARDAGADELLGMFSHFNVAKAIAQQMGITLDAAYQLPWETVAVYLLHERRSAILADNIQRNARSSHE